MMRWLLVLVMPLLLPAAELLGLPASPTAAHKVVAWQIAGMSSATLTCDGVVRSSFPTATGCEIRHAPRRAGSLPWKIEAAGKVLGSGTLVVTPATGGPIRLVNRRLVADDGTPFLPLGPNIAWVDGEDPLPGFRRYFERLARDGGTHARVWLCSWCLGLGEDLDPQRAAQVDAVLAAARAKGLRLTMVLENHTDLLKKPGWSAVPLMPVLARRLNYAVARWGADDTVLAWELGNELDLAETDADALDRWLTVAADLIRAGDPDRRPVISSWSGPGWATSHAPLDWVGVHPYVHEFTDADAHTKKADHDAVMAFEHAARQGRLWWPMEGGFQGRQDHNPGNDRDQDGLLLRQHLWAGFCLGLAPAMNWWWDTHVDARGLWPVYGALGRIAARLDWRDSDLQQFTPNPKGALRVLGWTAPTQALLWPQVRSDTWYRAIVSGLPRTGLAQRQPVGLGGFRPGQDYTWERWHAVDGTPGLVTTLRADGNGVLTPTLAPGVVDEVWVLRLTSLVLK